MIKLYDYELSGNCYKVRQLLAWLGLSYERVLVDFYPGRAHQSPDFLDRLNPLGQLPVIEDDGYVLRDAQAILVYLATRHDAERRWYPDEAALRGEVAMWLAMAETLTRTAAVARLHQVLGYEGDLSACQHGAHQALRVIDDHLAEQATANTVWLVGSEPTLADLACFPYAALAPEGGILLDGYPTLRRWLWNFRHLPGFVGMAGLQIPNRLLTDQIVDVSDQV